MSTTIGTAHFRLFLFGFGASALGSGLIYPVIALYLSEARGLGATSAGVYFAAVALGCFATAPLGGWLSDRAGPHLALAAGAAIQAAACVAILAAPLPWELVAGGAVFGGGSGLATAAVTPIVCALTTAERRQRAFVACFVAMNIGIGLGAAIGGVVVARLDSLTGYQVVLAADALSYVVYLVVVLVAHRPVEPPAPAGDDAPATARAGYRSALADRRFLRLLLAHTTLVLFGYSQLDSAVPVLLHTRLGIGTGVIGSLILVNTVAAVCLPTVVGRLTRTAPRITVLRAVAGVWAAGLLVVAAGALAEGHLRIAVMGLFAALFAAGECLYASSFQPLVTELSPPQATGRYAALAAMSWEVGSMVGPAVGMTVVGSGGVTTYVSVFGGGLLVAGIALAPLRARRGRGALRPAPQGVST